MEALDGLQLRWGRSLRCVLQTEAAECGLACLAMVSGYWGDRVDLRTLRSRFAVSLKGMNAVQLIDVAAQMGLAARALRIELDALEHLHTPAILHWDFNHFVVLKRVRRGRAVIVDPASGERTVPLADMSAHFTGVAFELQPSMRFKPSAPRERVEVRRLMGKVRGLRASLAQVILLAGALEVFGIFGPFLTQWLIDDALVSADRDLITVIVGAIFVFGLLQMAIGLVRSWVVMHMSTSLSLQWTGNVLRHLLGLPLDFFEKRHIGDVLSRFGSTGAIQQTLTTSFVTAVLDGLMAVTTLVMMAIYSAKLAAIAAGAVILYGLLRVLRYGALREASEGQIVRQARQQTLLMESLRGIQAIKLFSREADRLSRYLKLSVDVANAQVRILRLTYVFQACNATLVAIEGALILWIGSHSVLDGAFTIGMLVAFVSYKDQFTTRLMSLVDRVVELLMLRIQGERLADIVLATPEAAGRQLVPTEHLAASIELRDVSFRYGDGEPWVLRGVNLSVAAGESVAIVGPSGCGKSTLLKIILGLLQPQEGEVLVGGVPVDRIGMANYRALVGAVMQTDTLFAGSLADNISFFDAQPDQARIEECARLAAIDETIRRMPMGYHSLVGDMGSALSGGQVQRLLLARALYKQPRILVLDEATSNLDVAAERRVAARLATLPITRVVVAHRPDTIALSGRVIRIGAQAAPAPVAPDPERGVPEETSIEALS